MTSRLHTSQDHNGLRHIGFTLIELLAVMAIIGVLASLVVGAGRFAKIKALESKARAGLQHIANALNDYQLQSGVYPNNLSDISGRLPPGAAALDGSRYPLDPWKQRYEYVLGAQNRSYTLYSRGRLNDPGDPNRADDDIYPGK